MHDQITSNTDSKVKASFCDWAARFSLIMPFVLIVATFGLIGLMHASNGFMSGFLGCEVVLLFISFVFGAISMMGFQYCRRKFSLWIALAGVLISGAVGFAAFLLYSLSSGWSGC
jgi:hypothetical protein